MLLELLLPSVDGYLALQVTLTAGTHHSKETRAERKELLGSTIRTKPRTRPSGGDFLTTELSRHHDANYNPIAY